jgi:hypothetical protein
MALSIPKKALVPVLDEDDCVIAWAVNVVTVDYVALGYTLGEDTDSPVVPLYDADNCVVGWVLKTVPTEETP